MNWYKVVHLYLVELAFEHRSLDQRSRSLYHSTFYLGFMFSLCLVGFLGDAIVIPHDICK